MTIAKIFYRLKYWFKEDSLSPGKVLIYIGLGIYIIDYVSNHSTEEFKKLEFIKELAALFIFVIVCIVIDMFIKNQGANFIRDAGIFFSFDSQFISFSRVPPS